MGAAPSSAADAAAPPSLSPLRLSVALRQKLGRGSHYNLKLLIRGDLQTGKSSLHRHLQGLPFAPQIASSRELAVAHVDWACPESADTVKLEVWDVVEADLCRKPAGLALAHRAVAAEASPPVSPAGGGESGSLTIDVWRGSHGAIVLFDPRKPWSLQHAVRSMGEAPAPLPVLLLANFSDQAGAASCGADVASGEVPWADVEAAAQDETRRSGRIVICDRCCMLSGAGLETVYRFVALPCARALGRPRARLPAPTCTRLLTACLTRQVLPRGAS